MLVYFLISYKNFVINHEGKKLSNLDVDDANIYFKSGFCKYDAFK